MLKGKKFPENVCALRLLTEELLQMFFLDSPVDNYDSLMNILEEKATISKNTSEKHKEEENSRIKDDAKDRSSLRAVLSNYIHPLDPKQHPTNDIVNILTGQLSGDNVNVAEALEEGTKSLKNFESGLPAGFHNPITKVIKTISDSKQTTNRPSKPPVDPEVIYARSLAIRSIDPSFNFEEQLKYELALFPPSMFKEEGDMRTPTNKSALKNELKVEMSSCSLKPTALFIDGGAILYNVYWSDQGTISDFLDNFRAKILHYLQQYDVYLTFDHYFPDSEKQMTRNACGSTEMTRVYTNHNYSTKK